MKATKLIINWEEQNLCDCSQNEDVVIPVVSELPANPVDWQMVIYGDNLEIYYGEWRIIVGLAQLQ